MAISVKQVLVNEKQMEAIKKVREEWHKRSGIGIAPTLYEIARRLIDKALTNCM